MRIRKTPLVDQWRRRDRGLSGVRLNRVHHLSIFIASVFLSTVAQAMPGPGDEGRTDPAVTSNTGTAKHQIPIELPPGPGGLVPSVAIHYSSRQGDSPYGVGWGLNLGEIRCSARLGVPNYAYASCKNFELNGQLLTRDGSTNSYHSFVETFQQIKYLSASKSWQVINPNGTIMRYGLATDARVMSGSNIARWLLSEIEDPFGNKIFVSYDDTTDTGMRYPALITYGAGATKAAGKREVKFVFGEDRPDPIHDFRGGLQRVVTKRLTEINVLSYDAFVRRYAFGYDGAGKTYTTNRSRLSSVQQFGSDCIGAISGCTGLPSQEYKYTDSYDDGKTAPFSKHSRAGSYQAAASPRPTNHVVDFQRSLFTPKIAVRMADINGDGLPDLIEGGIKNGSFGESEATLTATETNKVKINIGFGFAEDAAWTLAFNNLQVAHPRADYWQTQPNLSQGGGQDVLHYFAAGGIIDDSSMPVVYTTVNQPNGFSFPAGTSRPDARYSAGLSPLIGEIKAGFVEGKGRLHFTDVDGDGFADIVVSVDLSGVDKVLDKDGFPIPPASVVRQPGLTVRKVYRNTGDPTTGGWVEDPELARGLPPFGIVQFESEYGAESRIPFGLSDPDIPNDGLDVIDAQFAAEYGNGPCAVRGLYGAFPPQIYSPNVCLNFVDLAPTFTDLNGDGVLDLMVIELPDSEALHQGDVRRIERGSNAKPLLHNKGRSRAWIQVPDAALGEDRWVRAPQHDLPNMPFNGHYLFSHSSPELHGGSNPINGCGARAGLFGNIEWPLCGPSSYSYDSTVRLVDLNRDGLSDVMWSNQGFAGVLLNTGTGWCSSNPAYVTEPEVEFACEDASMYFPPPKVDNFAGPFGFGVSIGTQIESTGHFTDLNSDGFLDFLQVHVRNVSRGNKAWLFNPAGATEEPPNMWIRDDRYDIKIDNSLVGTQYSNPDYLSIAILDLDGDGAPDIVGDDLRSLDDHTQFPHVYYFDGGHSDLLNLVRNGRGGQKTLRYSTAIKQRNTNPGDENSGYTALESHATQHALDTGESLDGSTLEDVIRWTSAPVVSSVTISGPNMSPSTTLYEYAHPRFCIASQSDLGFRVVQRARLGKVVISSFYQAHGRAGKTYEVLVAGYSVYNEYWETQEFSAMVPGESRPNVPSQMPGSINHPHVNIGRLAKKTSQNLIYGASPAVGSRSSTTYHYDDTYGYNFVEKMHEARRSGGQTILRRPLPITANGISGLVSVEEIYDYESAEIGGTDFLKSTVFAYDNARVDLRGERVMDRGSSWDGFPKYYTMGHDSFGNLTSETEHAASGSRVTYYCYDGDQDIGGVSDACPDFGQDSHSVRVGVLDAIGGFTTLVPDAGTGTIIMVGSTYVDQPLTRTALDVFGRPVSTFVTGQGVAEVRTSKTVYEDVPFAPAIVSTLVFLEAGAADADAVWSSVVLNGYGGVWKEITESTTGYVGTVTHVSPTTVSTSLPVSCGDQRCSNKNRGNTTLAQLTAVDAIGRPAFVQTVHGTTTYEYSAMPGASVTGPWAASADAFDVVNETNGKGDLTRRGMDGDRILWVDECEGNGTCTSAAPRTFYSYEATGEINTIFDAKADDFDDSNHSLRYYYDTLGRIVKIDDPALDGTGHSLTTYDTYGNVFATTNARGQQRTHTYDKLNRLTGIVTPIGETNFSLQYRAGEKQAGTEVSDDYTRVFTFNDLGRLQHESTSIWDDNRSPWTLYTDFEYDLVGRVTEAIYPAKHYEAGSWTHTKIRYEHDGAFLTKICDLGTGADCSSASQEIVGAMNFDSLGRPIQMTIPGGDRNRTYHSDNHRIWAESFDSTAYDFTRTYKEYDGIGNILEIDDSLSPSSAAVVNTTFSYDGRNRIKTWKRGAVTQNYGYDELGNLTLHDGEPQVYGDSTRPHAIQRRTTAAGTHNYHYDDDGNVASIVGAGPSQYFQYNSANQIVCIGSTSTGCDTRVAYDVSGKRIVEYPGGAAFNAYTSDAFLYEHVASGSAANTANVEVMLDGRRIAFKRFEAKLRGATSASVLVFDIPTPWIVSGAGCVLVALTFWGLRSGVLVLVELRPLRAATALTAAGSLLLPSIAMAGGGGGAGAPPSYYWELSDPLGTGVILLDKDGGRVRHQVFTPFGRIHEESGAAFRTFYAGHRRNEDSGMFYMQARWYDPGAGRFLSTDPLIRSAAVPQSANAYSYTENNPVNGNDPTGMIRGLGADIDIGHGGFVSTSSISIGGGTTDTFVTSTSGSTSQTQGSGGAAAASGAAASGNGGQSQSPGSSNNPSQSGSGNVAGKGGDIGLPTRWGKSGTYGSGEGVFSGSNFRTVVLSRSAAAAALAQGTAGFLSGPLSASTVLALQGAVFLGVGLAAIGAGLAVVGTGGLAAIPLGLVGFGAAATTVTTSATGALILGTGFVGIGATNVFAADQLRRRGQ